MRHNEIFGKENTKWMIVDSIHKISRRLVYCYRNLNIGGQNCCGSVDDFFLLLGRVDGDNIRKRGGRALLALRIPIKHDLNFDTKNSLSEKNVSNSRVNIVSDWLT